MVERPTADDIFLAAGICWPPIRFRLHGILEEALARLYQLAHKGLLSSSVVVGVPRAWALISRALDVLILVRLSRSLGGNRFPSVEELLASMRGLGALSPLSLACSARGHPRVLALSYPRAVVRGHSRVLALHYLRAVVRGHSRVLALYYLFGLCPA
jgi:hypothetical protein